jgi:tetratricopeptide (TPR) repeat protein
LSHCYINLGEPDKAIELLQKSIHLKLKLEKDNLLGPPLATLGTAYRNKFQYGKAIENYKKALGKFSLIQNDYQKGRTLIPLARCLCDMGLADKAEDYLKKGHEICQRFNEPLIMGRINNFQANIHLLRQDYDKAIHFLEESLEIFRDGELRKPSAEIMLEMMCTHIIFSHPDKLVHLKKNYERILIKLTNTDRTDTLMECILYYINSHSDQPKHIDIHEIEKAINGMDISESQYMAWWILAKSSGKLGDVGREKDYYANAVKIIQRLGDMIGDEICRKSFLNKFPIREILEGKA